MELIQQKKPSEIANTKRIKTINNFFNKETSSKIKKNYGQFDFITSHNVLAHTEDIQENMWHVIL